MSTQTIYRKPGKATYTFIWSDVNNLRKEVKEVNTRELLSWRNRVNRLISKGIAYPDNWYADAHDRPDGFDHYDPVNLHSCLEIIKEELSTREHIPNKKEAKELRRLKAQGKF